MLKNYLKELILNRLKPSKTIRTSIIIWFILAIILIFLKLFNFINIPIIWCFSPLWLPFAAILILIIWFSYPIFKAIKYFHKWF